MATKIVTKNSSTASAVPTASDLVQGELAVNVADKRLFTEDNGGSIIELGTNPSTIDINAGTIDGTTIGASSASTGAFTTLTATGLDVTGSIRGTQLEAYKTNHGGDVSVAANQLGNAYENLASTASLILGATATSTINSTKIVADHSGGATNNHVQDLVFYPVGGNSQNFEAMRISSLGALTVKNVANGHTVFNENGVDSDFRVESDNNTHALFVNGADGNVSFGTSDGVGGVQIQSSGSTSDITLYGASASHGGRIFFGDSSDRSSIQGGYDSGGGGYLKLFTDTAGGSNLERVYLDNEGGFVVTPTANGHAVFNEGGVDADFRVESDTSSHALFLNSAELRWGINRTDPQKTLEISSNLEQLRLSTASEPTNYYTDISSRYDSVNPFRMTGYYNGTTVNFIDITAGGGFSAPILKLGAGMTYTSLYTGTSERISIQPTLGSIYENIYANITGNFDLTFARGQKFARAGSIANEVKSRIFLGNYTYNGGTIDYVITKDAGSQTHVGSGTINWYAREAVVHHTITGTNESSQIVVNGNQYTTAGAAGKFTFSIRATNGDSHLTIQNRLGTDCNIGLRINVNYVG